MGFFEWINDRADDVAEAVEGGVEWLGDFSEGAARMAAQGADAVGLESARDFLNGAATEIANATGAEVDELELGQTRDPKALIVGEPASIEGKSDKVRTVGDSLGAAGSALAAIDVSDWEGSGADAFRALWSMEPGYWDDANQAFSSAADAMTTFAGQLTSAQDKAQTAIDKWDQAQHKQDEFDRLDDAEKATSTLDIEAEQLRSEAQQFLEDGRRLRDESVGTFAATMNSARDLAPENPPFVNRLGMDLADARGWYTQHGLSVIDGFATAASGTVAFVNSINPISPYNLSHPWDYGSKMTDLASGVVVAAADPGAVVTQMWDEAMKDPSKALGGAAFEIVTSLGSGGASAAAKGGARAARGVAESATGHPPGIPGGKGVPAAGGKTPGHGHQTPHSPESESSAGSGQVPQQGSARGPAEPGGHPQPGGNRPSGSASSSRGGRDGSAEIQHPGSDATPHQKATTPDSDGLSAAGEPRSGTPSTHAGPDARQLDQPAPPSEGTHSGPEHGTDNRSSALSSRTESNATPRDEVPSRSELHQPRGSELHQPRDGHAPDSKADTPRNAPHWSPEGRAHSGGETNRHEPGDHRIDDHRSSRTDPSGGSNDGLRPQGILNSDAPRTSGVTHALDDHLYRIGPEDGDGLEPSSSNYHPDSGHGTVPPNGDHFHEGSGPGSDGGHGDAQGEGLRSPRTGDELFNDIFQKFTSNLKGRFGEFLTQAWLELNGYKILAESPPVTVEVDGRSIVTKPDFLAIDRHGDLVAVESKLGPNAGFTPNQKLAYPQLADGSTFNVSADSDFADELIELQYGRLAEGGKVQLSLSEIRLMDWNDLRPSNDLVRLAGVLASGDTVRKLPLRVADGISTYLGTG